MAWGGNCVLASATESHSKFVKSDIAVIEKLRTFYES